MTQTVPESNCTACPGQQVVFECTIFRASVIQLTLWSGSALDCTSGISLSHVQFINSGHSSGTCNNGAILARMISIVDNCYTSQLIVIVNTSSNLDGESIRCSFDDGLMQEPVDTKTIRTPGG